MNQNNMSQNNMNQNNMSQNNMNQNNINQNNLNFNMEENIINKNTNIQNNPIPNSNVQKNLKPTQTGLQNFGDTSYLNSVLQFLGNIKEFATFFLKKENIEYLHNNVGIIPFSFIICRLFMHLYPEKQKKVIYKPEAIFRYLGELNEDYKNKERKNPNDLLKLILNTLHEELNKKKYANNPIQNAIIYNENEVIESGYKNFSNKNDSIISDLLYWFELKESRCNRCLRSRYDFSAFNIFELDLLGAFQNNQNPVNIKICLDNYQKGKNQILYCINCSQYSETYSSTNILQAPNILIFSLNRGDLNDEYNQLVKIPFFFEENLDLTSIIKRPVSNMMNYTLTGIVSLFKEGNKWLFVSFCKSHDQQWYFYHDENIHQMQLNNILEMHVNNAYYIPCILLYRLIYT